MRVAAHVVVALNDDPHTLATRVIRDGIATHGHPRALVGGLVHALMLRNALRQTEMLEYGDLVEQILNEPLLQQAPIEDAVPEDWLRAFEQHSGEPVQVAWKRTVEELEALLQIVRGALNRAALANDEATLKDLGCFDPSTNGAGTVTAAASAYLAARSAARPMKGLLRAAFLEKADTDTLASMTSSLLSALHGHAWLGELGRDVQDAKYLVKISELVVEPRVPGRSQPALFDNEPPSDSRARKGAFVSQQQMSKFLDEIGEHDPGAEARFVDGRRCVLVDRSAPEALAKISVTRLRLQLEDGQTMIIDRTRRDQVRTTSSRRAGHMSLDSPMKRAPAPGKAQEQGSQDKPPYMGALTSITLVVRDLPAVAHFYRNVLGLPVRGSGGGGFVTVGEWLLIRQSSDVEDRSRRRLAAVIEITVTDIEKIRGRIGEEPPRHSSRDVLEIHDPEGNLVIVRAGPGGP